MSIVIEKEQNSQYASLLCTCKFGEILCQGINCLQGYTIISYGTLSPELDYLKDNGFLNADKIYLAGAFGNYMNIENTVTIGLLPDTNRDKFVRFFNGALAGARDMLLSQDRRKDAERIAIMV